VVVAYLPSASPLVNEFVATSQLVLAPLQTKEGNVIAEERSSPATAAPVAPSQTTLTQLPAKESNHQVLAEERAPPAIAAPVATNQPVLAQLPAKESEDQVIAEERDSPAAVPANFPRADCGRGVRVEATYTSVRVNPDRGKVHVRAPFVDLDIRW
jgi:hypothetical protein